MTPRDTYFKFLSDHEIEDCLQSLETVSYSIKFYVVSELYKEYEDDPYFIWALKKFSTARSIGLDRFKKERIVE